jgi:hypothetical protein
MIKPNTVPSFMYDAADINLIRQESAAIPTEHIDVRKRDDSHSVIRRRSVRIDGGGACGIPASVNSAPAITHLTLCHRNRHGVPANYNRAIQI